MVRRLNSNSDSAYISTNSSIDPININMNDGGSSGTIACYSSSGFAQIRGISNTNLLTINAPNTDIRLVSEGGFAEIRAVNSDHINITAKSLYIEASGSSSSCQAGIIIGNSSTNKDITLNISGAITVAATANEAQAYIETYDGDINLTAAPASLSITSTNGGEAYIHAQKSGATERNIVWAQDGMFGSGGITLSSTGAGSQSYIKADGQLKLGTADNPIAGKVDIDAANGGIAYIGDSPLASSSSLTALDVYATGDITLDTSNSSGSNASYAYIYRYGSSPAFTTNVNTSGGDISLTSAGYLGSVAAIQGAGVNVRASGDITLQTTGSGSSRQANIYSIDDGFVTTTGGSINLISTGSYIESGSALTVTAATDVSLSGNAYAYSVRNLLMIAGREIILNDTAYLNKGGGAGNLTVVTDNAYPSPSGSPNVGIGNLTMASGASLRTDDDGAEIRVYAGYDENNRADIHNSATFNGVAYSELKGILDTQDANNRFHVYYNVDTPHTYNGPATFYYKETTPTETIAEGNVQGATEVASSSIPSFVVSSYLGDTLLDFLRKGYITNTRGFYQQYGRAKVPYRRRAIGNKTPRSQNAKASDRSSSDKK